MWRILNTFCPREQQLKTFDYRSGLLKRSIFESWCYNSKWIWFRDQGFIQQDAIGTICHGLNFFSLYRNSNNVLYVNRFVSRGHSSCDINIRAYTIFYSFLEEYFKTLLFNCGLTMEMITEAAIRGLWVTNDIRKGCMEWQLSSSTVPHVRITAVPPICIPTLRRVYLLWHRAQM